MFMSPNFDGLLVIMVFTCIGKCESIALERTTWRTWIGEFHVVVCAWLKLVRRLVSHAYAMLQFFPPPKRNENRAFAVVGY